MKSHRVLPLAIAFLSTPAMAAGDGPDFVAMGLQAFNIALLFGIIAFFAGRKIRDAMADRATEIRRDIEESNRLRKEASERVAELEARLQGFEQRLAEMKANAEHEAQVERTAILERAEKDAARLLEAAERTLRSETAKARMALRSEAVALSVALAEERVSGAVSANDDQRLAESFFSEVSRG